MIKKLLYTVVVIGICAALAWWLWGRADSPEPNPEFGTVATPVQAAPLPHRERLSDVAGEENGPNLSERLTQRYIMEALDAYYSRPIEMYGKVIDQYQQPVAGANIRLIADDQPLGSGTEFQAKSDLSGRFQLTNARGARVIVVVSMDGYHAGDAALQGFSPGEVTSDNPAIFVLHKVGEIEPVYYHRHDRVDFRDPRGGTVGFDFISGSFPMNGTGALQARISTDIEERFQSHVNWEYELVIEGGGFAVRNGPLDFIAPEDGYTERIRGRFTPDDPDRIRSVVMDYFMKLPDGTYARGEIRVKVAGGTGIVIRDCVYNPSGSRNLELNPEKSNIINQRQGR